MEDFDLLYLLKTPFFLGNSHKAMEEANELEIDESDVKNNELKNFYLIRILADLGDLPRLKAHMSTIFESHSSLVQSAGSLVQYLVSGKVDQEYLNGEIEKVVKSPSTYSESQLSVLVYLTYLLKDYDRLFELTNNTNNIELLSVKLCGYVEIYRYDLAKQVLEKLKEIEDDNCLTNLWEIILAFASKESIEKWREKVVELGEKNEYTLKIYVLLGLTMMRDGKFDNAGKVFDKAFETLNIFEDHTQYQKYVVSGNEDMASLWVNYLKWNAILYNPEGETTEKVKKILKIVSPKNSYWKEQELTSQMFDEALN